MPENIVEFSFSLWQPVKLILAGGTKGVVEGMMKDADGLSYKVRYWHNNERKVIWVRIDEIVGEVNNNGEAK